MKVPLYYMWSDAFFYIYFIVFAGSLAFLIYAIRRWLELANADPYAEEAEADLELAIRHGELPSQESLEAALPEPEPEPHPEPEAPADLEPQAAAAEAPLPQPSADFEKTVMMPNIEELVAQATREGARSFPAESAAAPAARREEAPAPEPAHDNSRAEEFVKGIYGHIAGIEARLGAIEESISKGGGNRHFTVKFLEGILEDYDSLSVGKIKARVEYLISDLKENKTAE